jgi:hypothetical protein
VVDTIAVEVQHAILNFLLATGAMTALWGASKPEASDQFIKRIKPLIAEAHSCE